MPWDIFISYASEDRASVAEPLKRALGSAGLSVWMDAGEEKQIKLGDSIRQGIEIGLSRSRWGVVLLSPAYLGKYWPEAELDALFAREAEGRKVVLPVYVGITHEEIRARHPMLSSRHAATWADGIDKVVAAILEAVNASTAEVSTSVVAAHSRAPASGELAVIVAPDGQHHFFECQRITVAGTATLLLRATEGRQAATLSSLRSAGQSPVSVAFGLRAIVGRVQSVSETRESGEVLWTLVIRPDPRAFGDALMQEMSFNNISADELATMRARRILLNEKLPSARAGSGVPDSTLEVFVRGMGVPLPVESSPFRLLFGDLGGTPQVFLRAAKVMAVLWLHLSGVVEHIFTLDLELKPGPAMDVRFEGQRRRRFTNAEPAVIKVEGSCKLDDVQPETRP